MDGGYDGRKYDEDYLDRFHSIDAAYLFFRAKPPKPERKVPKKEGTIAKQVAEENETSKKAIEVALAVVEAARATEEPTADDLALNDPADDEGEWKKPTCKAAAETFLLLRKLESVRDRWPDDWNDEYDKQDAKATMTNLDDILAIVKELKGRTP